MNTAVMHGRPEKIEVYRFSPWATVGIPLLALFFQAFIPLRLHFFEIFNLPLLVTIFFAVARRSPVKGLITGATIGLLQDSLTHHAIGVEGIALTVVGFAASSMGARVDVENPGTRLLMTFGFYLVNEAIYFFVARGMVGEMLMWQWSHKLAAALANSILALILFLIMDRVKEPA
jgi:rod shape-determining protein MreD